jgi:cytochrome c oxidase subunit II
MFKTRGIAPFLLVVGLAVGAAACGSSSDDSASNANLSPDAKAGQSLYEQKCSGCHSVDGSSKVGPTLKGLAGSTVALQSGQSVTADDTYLTKSIEDPSADIVKGYPSVMASAIPKGSISDDQARRIVTYIDTLKQ